MQVKGRQRAELAACWRSRSTAGSLASGHVLMPSFVAIPSGGYSDSTLSGGGRCVNTLIESERKPVLPQSGSLRCSKGPRLRAAVPREVFIP
jgi:hypothetical protein